MDFEVINKSVLFVREEKGQLFNRGEDGIADTESGNEQRKSTGEHVLHTSVARSLGKSVRRFVYF